MKLVSRLLAAALLAGMTAAAPATASTITFGAGGDDAALDGAITEDGFTYARVSGSLVLSSTGNPGGDLEGDLGTPGGGVVRFTSATSGGLFNFQALDYRAFSLATSQTLNVSGFLGDALVATDSFTTVGLPTLGEGLNWATYAATNLAGRNIDALRITLGSTFDLTAPDVSFQSIDNVQLAAVSTPPVVAAAPEPGSWALMIVGFGAVGLVLRRRRQVTRVAFG